MRILVAGATGVIGKLLVPMLIEAGHEVAGTTRRPDRASQIAAMGAKPIVMDALDREGAFAVMHEYRPALLMHQMTDLAMRDFAANARLRIEGTLNLIDAAWEVGVTKVIAQSISWTYAPGTGPASEDEPMDFDAPEGSRQRLINSTSALEETVAEIAEYVILRYGLLYGPDTFYARDGSVADAVRAGTMKATDGVSSFVHIEDAARAALQALDWPAGIVNIVDDEPAPGTEWLPIYAELIGAPPPPIQSGGAPWERGASNQKAHSILGWQPLYPTWRDGFKTSLG